MAKLTVETFADWVAPSDAVDWFIRSGRGEDAAKARVIAMLCDGLLVAAAAQLIVDGRDLGLAMIPRDVWPAAASTSV